MGLLVDMFSYGWGSLTGSNDRDEARATQVLLVEHGYAPEVRLPAEHQPSWRSELTIEAEGWRTPAEVEEAERERLAAEYEKAKAREARWYERHVDRERRWLKRWLRRNA